MNAQTPKATFCLALMLVLSTGAGAVDYTTRILPLPAGYTYGGACDINDGGQILGYYGPDASYNNWPQICIWDGAGFHDLGFRGNSDRSGHINNNGDAVIASRLWRDGHLDTLPVPLDPPYGVRVTNINERSHVCGGIVTDVTSPRMQAAFWDDVQMHDLGIPLDYVSNLAWDMNEHGQVVSTAEDGIWSNAKSAAFIWDNGVMAGLGMLPGMNESVAVAINNQGQVVGNSFNEANQYSGIYEKAFIWQNGIMTDLLGLDGVNSVAVDVTDNGMVLGYTWSRGGGEQAFIWRSGQITWLPRIGVESHVYGINENGWVVGLAGLSQAAVWEPVPEPSSLIALLCGIGAYRIRRRARVAG